MKLNLTKFILGILTITFVLTSCKNNENDLNLQSDASIQNVGGILKFKNQEVFNATMDSLNTIDADKQTVLLSSYGVKSYKNLKAEANKELDQIIDTVSSKAIFESVYKGYISKYQSQFLFSGTSSEYISPISKLVDARLEKIVNSAGEYMIGDKVIKAAMYTDINEFNSKNKTIAFDLKPQLDGMAKVTTSPNLNAGDIRTSKRKAFVTIYLESINLSAVFTAQEKTWLGYWKSYETIFNLQFTVNKPFIFNGSGAASTANTTMMYTSPKDENAVQPTLGYFIYGSDLTGITGHFLLWTRGIDQTDGVEGTIKFN